MKCALVKAKMCYGAEISCYITFTQNTVFSPTDRDCFFVEKTSQEYGVRPRQSGNALRCRDFVLYHIHSKRLLFCLTDRDYFFFQKKEVKSIEHALVKAEMCYGADVSCYLTFTQNTLFPPTDRDLFF